jgi:hypothetical protein
MKLFARKYSSLYVIMGALLFQTLTLSTASADIITLETANMGYYWSQRSTWMGGSSTDSGFSYGDDAGLQHVQNNYQYYGGSDRFWQRKDLYFQIDLSSITGDLEEAVFHFYVTVNNSPAPSVLKHVDTQTTPATGDAGQKLAGSTDVAGTDSFVVGWNSVDVTSFIQSDLDNGYSFAAFSIPKFGSVQDQNRLLSLYGPTSTELVDGQSTQPYLATIPEPATMSLLALGFLGGLALIHRRRTA